MENAETCNGVVPDGESGSKDIASSNDLATVTFDDGVRTGCTDFRDGKCDAVERVLRIWCEQSIPPEGFLSKLDGSANEGIHAEQIVEFVGAGGMEGVINEFLAHVRDSLRGSLRGVVSCFDHEQINDALDAVILSNNPRKREAAVEQFMEILREGAATCKYAEEIAGE